MVRLKDPSHTQDSHRLSLRIIGGNRSVGHGIIRNHTDAPICLHICGSAYAFLQEFVEMGIGVLNPVQIRAKDMEPEKLKGEFGDKISFHGGVDSQELLPHASPEEVDQEVRRLVKVLGKDGGYILASCHSKQPDVSPENIKALFAAERNPARI